MEELFLFDKTTKQLQRQQCIHYAWSIAHLYRSTLQSWGGGSISKMRGIFNTEIDRTNQRSPDI